MLQIPGDQLPVASNLLPAIDSDDLQAWIDPLGKTDRRTWENQETYLVAFGKLGVRTKSAGMAGVSIETVRLWDNDNKLGFRGRARDAQSAYADYLESLALTRVEHPEGNRGGDTLLIALNNANNPDKWRGNTTTLELSDQLRDFMQKRQAEDQEKALPEGKVLEHRADEPAPWEN